MIQWDDLYIFIGTTELIIIIIDHHKNKIKWFFLKINEITNMVKYFEVPVSNYLVIVLKMMHKI